VSRARKHFIATNEDLYGMMIISTQTGTVAIVTIGNSAAFVSSLKAIVALTVPVIAIITYYETDVIYLF